MPATSAFGAYTPPATSGQVLGTTANVNGGTQHGMGGGTLLYGSSGQNINWDKEAPDPVQAAPTKPPVAPTYPVAPTQSTAPPPPTDTGGGQQTTQPTQPDQRTQPTQTAAPAPQPAAQPATTASNPYNMSQQTASGLSGNWVGTPYQAQFQAYSNMAGGNSNYYSMPTNQTQANILGGITSGQYGQIYTPAQQAMMQQQGYGTHGYTTQTPYGMTATSPTTPYIAPTYNPTPPAYTPQPAPQPYVPPVQPNMANNPLGMSASLASALAGIGRH